MERPNYITPQGLQTLKDEKHQLWSVERSEVVKVVTWAAGNGDRSENADYQYGKRRLREIDRRVRFLTKRIEAAVVVNPEEQTNRDQIFLVHLSFMKMNVKKKSVCVSWGKTRSIRPMV